MDLRCTTSRAERIWLAAALLVILLAVAAQARFALIDRRTTADANHAHHSLPAIHHCLGSPHDWPLSLSAAVTETAGWYNLLLSAGMRLTGTRHDVMKAFHIFWVAAVLVGLFMLARRLWGGAAGLAVLLLIPPHAMWIHQLGRMGWIHVAELALVLCALDAMAADPALDRWRTVARASLCGLLALALRPTGIIWVASLAPLLIPWFRRAPARWRAISMAGIWALALVPLARDLGPYLADKLEVRASYGALTGPGLLLPQLLGDMGAPWIVMALAGLVLLLRRRGQTPPRIWIVLGAWLLLPPLLSLGFNVGLVNFPVLYAALALLGAGGLARLPRAVLLIPALLWIGVYAAQWLPAQAARQIYGGILHAPVTLHRDGPNNYYRPHAGLGADEVEALLSATCPRSKARCIVQVESGLFHPAALDPGRLGLFLMGGMGRVRLVELRDLDMDNLPPPPHAHPRVACPAHSASFEQRQPGMAKRGTELRAALELRQVWARELEPGCRYLWYTPGGRVAARSALP